MVTKAGQIQVDLQVGFDKNAMNNAISGVSKGMNDLAGRTQQAVRRTTGQSAAAFAGIGAALTGSFAFGARAAAQFEDEFANVKKTLDVSGTAEEVEEKFANIAKELRNIAKFSPASVTELNQIAAVGGQLGIAADEIVKFTDTIQKLTVATNLSAEQAALSLARLQKITGLTSNDIDNLGSVIVKLGNNFATTESEIINAATQIATATAGTSTPFNNAAVDALAFATALRAIGQPAQAGSTAMIRLIQVIDRAVGTGDNKLLKIADIAGLTAQGFQDLSKVDPNRAVALFIEGLGKAEKEGKDVVAVLEELGLGQIRSRRAIQALSRAQQEQGSTTVPLLVAALDMANEEFIENTALITEAERRYATVNSQIQILKNTVNEAGVEFGTKFLPTLNSMVTGLTNFITSFSDLEKTTKILGGFALGIGSLVQVVRGSVTAFRILTTDLLEYQAAVNLAATGNMGLEASQKKLLFTAQQFRKGNLITDMRFRPKNIVSDLRNFQKTQLQQQLGASQFMQGPVQNPLGNVGPQLPIPAIQSFGQIMQGSLSKNVGVFSKELKEARNLMKQTGLGFKDLRRPALLLGDDFAGLKARIVQVNAATGASIPLTTSAKAGMMGLSLAVNSVTAAFKGMALGLVKVIKFLAIFKVITDFFERIGAAKRGVEDFTAATPALIESMQELAQSQADLASLRSVRESELSGGADDEVIKTIDKRIEQIERSIISKQNNIDDATAQLLSSLFGSELQGQIDRTAIALGKAPEQFTKDFFSNMNGLITDFESGALPTVSDVVDAAIDSKALGKHGKTFKAINDELGFDVFAKEYFKQTDDFVDGLIGGTVGDTSTFISKVFGDSDAMVADQKKVAQGFKASFMTIDLSGQNMEKAMKKMSKKGSLLEQFIGPDVSMEDAKEIAALTELIVDTVSGAFSMDSKDFLNGIQDFDAMQSQLVKGRQELLMAQQRQLASVGLLANRDIIDVTESIAQFDKAQTMVTGLLEEKFKSANKGIEGVREELELTDDEMLNIAATIDSNLSNAVTNALSLFASMPTEIIGSFENFALDLLKKMDVTQAFESMVRELASNAPLLANEFAKQGISSINQLEQALANMPVTFALEKKLEESVIPEIQEAVRNARDKGDINSMSVGLGEDVSEGVIQGLELRKADIGRVFRDAIDNMYKEGDEEAGRKSPAIRSIEFANDVIDGFVVGFDASDFKLYKAGRKAVKSIYEGIADENADSSGANPTAILTPIIEFANTFSQAVSSQTKDFGIYTAYQNALRAFEISEQGVIKAEQQFNGVMRERATFSERMAKALSEVSRLEIEGRKGNIIVSEEISLLRQKLSIQEKVDALDGKRSAKQQLAIIQAQDNIEDLRAMNAKGVISNLELQAAEEDLAELRGDNVTEDEKKLAILELTQAEKDYNNFLEKALDTDDKLVAAREAVIRLREEETLQSFVFIEAQNAVSDAQEGVAESALAVERARGEMAKAISSDSTFITDLQVMIDKFGLSAKGLDDISNNHNVLSTLFQTPMTSTFMDPVIAAYKEVVKLQALAIYQSSTVGQALSLGMGVEEYKNFESARGSSFGSGGLTPEAVAKAFEGFATNFNDYYNSIMPNSPITSPDYGMGGRVSKYKYGGRGDPMTRALVGEYGPEEVKFMPGNGFMVKPLGTGKSGTVVNSLNVNVTGVPSDPISARKAAVQISKALRKLDKEGSSGTGLRRN